MVAVKEGQGDIHENQVGLKGGKLPQNVGEILRLLNLKAPGFQPGGNGSGDHLVVLHKIDAIHILPSSGFLGCGSGGFLRLGRPGGKDPVQPASQVGVDGLAVGLV